jgi:hypothetical protein
MKTTLLTIATAATIAGASLAGTTIADARHFSRHAHRAFGGVYGYATGYATPRVHMYAADHYHYHQRPIVGGSRINSNLNPDFQLGGAYWE